MVDTASGTAQDKGRLIDITLDEETIGRATPDIEHERAVAIYDLIEENAFQPSGDDQGPYRLNLSIKDKRLILDIRLEDESEVVMHVLSLTPFRRVIKDYFLICESYFEAIKTATPSKIEAVDMGRRGLHNEGSRILQERLEGKVSVDFDTARRLFTLICALYWRG